MEGEELWKGQAACLHALPTQSQRFIFVRLNRDVENALIVLVDVPKCECQPAEHRVKVRFALMPTVTLAILSAPTLV